MSELLRVENLSAGYGEAVILDGVSLSLAAGQTLALLGRNGTGKTTLINTLAGATRQHGGSITLARRRPAQAAVACARGGRHRLGAAGTQHLQVADGAREPHGGGPARALDAGAGVRDVSAAGRTQAQPGHAAVGRRAADAGRGPRAGAQPAPAAAGRAARRPGAHHRAGTAARHRAHHARRRACRPSSWSSIRRPSWRSRIARSCSTVARWCIPTRPGN